MWSLGRALLFVISSPAANGRSRRYVMRNASPGYICYCAQHCPHILVYTVYIYKVNCPCITTTTEISHYDIDDTVDGRNSANHLGCIKVCIDNGTFTISAGGGFLPSTLPQARVMPEIIGVSEAAVHMGPTHRRNPHGNNSRIVHFQLSRSFWGKLTWKMENRWTLMNFF